MADVNDPFTPGEIPAQAGQNYENLRGQWDSFLGDPKNLGAAMSIGMALSQPLRWGDSGFSAASRALGAGGESVRQYEAEDRKERELSSKETLREAQATAAEARAERAGSAAGTAAGRLGIASEALNIKRQQLELDRQRRLGADYETHLKNTKASNDRIEAANVNRRLLGQEPIKPVAPLTRDEWVQQNSFLSGIPTNVQGGNPSSGGVGPPEGTIIRNKTTGQRQVRQDGQWVDLPE